MNRTRSVDPARLVTVALAAAAILACAGQVAAVPQPQGLAVVDTLEQTAGDLRGLTRLDDGTTVMLVALPAAAPGRPDSEVTLRWLATDGGVTREHDVTGLLARGLAFDGKWFWSLGDATPERPAMLFKIESDTLFVEGEYPTPGHSPRDLTWADEGLWLVDRDRGRLDRFDPEVEEITRSHPTPAFSPAGVAYDGRDLWVSDVATGLLYRLNGRGTRWLGTVAAADWFARGREVPLVWRDGELLLLPATGGRVVRARAD